MSLINDENTVVFQYKHPKEKSPSLETIKFSTEPQFSKDFLLLRQPLKSDDYIFGSVLFKINLLSYKTQLREQLTTLLLLFPVELFIGLILAWWISRTYTQPFTELADAMKASDVQHNKYQYVKTSARNEVGILYDGYNHLIHQIEETTKGLRTAINHRKESDVANQAKSAFLANMSHELRTPLNAIIGYSELIREVSLELNHSEFAQDAENIQVAGKHLLSLINNVLDLSKIEAGKMDVHMEKIDVKNLLDELESTISPLLDQNNNQLIVEIEGSVDKITSDITKLRQILINLTSNANKFTNNGEITINVWRSEEQGSTWCNFRIQDTGIGMTPDQLSKLFKPFSQAEDSTARDYGGTGLGLTISKHFCHILGGDIRVESEPGKGSIFTISLPKLTTPELIKKTRS